MKILLHICCGPCAIYPLQRLREQGYEVHGLFYNPNIHPFQEFHRRLEAVKTFAAITDLPLELDDRYGLTDYLRQVVFHEQERCPRCYEMRLGRTAESAATGDFTAFTTTLLYSKYQNHELIRKRCEQLAGRHGTDFLYEDFRLGWQQGIDESRSMGLYRQPYCG
ncbi:MAG: epoxyqueuosine reductase QueH, partial [Desulfobulbus sp.]|nr:epoxyqueuosine reductase QueH [Desulfobulbus sp.]